MPDPVPALSLPAQLYLLAWDPARRRLAGGSHLHLLVRAGALTELVQRGLLVDDDGIATPADPDARTGDRVLDGLLELVTESRPRRWKGWVTSRARVTLREVRGQLTDEGRLRPRARRILGLLPATEYEPVSEGVVEALHKRVRYALTGPVPVRDVSERDAALVALAAAAEVRTVASGRERRRYRQRIEELTERSGAMAPVLRKVIREVHAAAAAAASSSAAGS